MIRLRNNPSVGKELVKREERFMGKTPGKGVTTQQLNACQLPLPSVVINIR